MMDVSGRELAWGPEPQKRINCAAEAGNGDVLVAPSILVSHGVENDGKDVNKIALASVQKC